MTVIYAPIAKGKNVKREPDYEDSEWRYWWDEMTVCGHNVDTRYGRLKIRYLPDLDKLVVMDGGWGTSCSDDALRVYKIHLVSSALLEN